MTFFVSENKKQRGKPRCFYGFASNTYRVTCSANMRHIMCQSTEQHQAKQGAKKRLAKAATIYHENSNLTYESSPAVGIPIAYRLASTKM